MSNAKDTHKPLSETQEITLCFLGVNQLTMIIIFGILLYFLISDSDKIIDEFSNYQRDNSLFMCDLSNNSITDTENESKTYAEEIAKKLPSFDLSGNTQSITSGLVVFGIIVSFMLIFAQYLLFIPIQIFLSIVWIFLFSVSIIRSHGNAFEKYENAVNQANVIISKIRNNLHIPLYNTCHSPQHAGGVSSNQVLTFIVSIIDHMGDDGDVIRFFIGLIQIIFLLIFSELISGNSLKITTMLFSIFISLSIVFMILGNLPSYPEYFVKIIYGIVAFVFLLVFFLLQIFFSKNMTIITRVISVACMILSLGLSIYSITFPNKDNPEGNKHSFGCLIYNYFSQILNSSGFRIGQLILIILGMIFLPNYNNNSLPKMMQETHGIPKIFFIIIVILFILLYTVIPIVLLITKFDGKIFSRATIDINDLPFYGIACKNTSYDICPKPSEDQ